MITLNGTQYRELRCNKCRKLICYEYVFAGRIAFVCPRCGEMTEIVFKHTDTKENSDTMKKHYQFSMKEGVK